MTKIATPLKSFFRSVLVMLVIFSGWSVSVAQAEDFPEAGDDEFDSKGVFRITFWEFGGSRLVYLEGPACVVRSDPHPQGADPSGVLGDGSVCFKGPLPISPSPATSDADIGLPFPSGFNSGGGQDEVHTEIVDMLLTSSEVEVSVKAGASVSPICQPRLQRSLGEVEARGGQSGFGGPGADSFFNLFLEVSGPFGNLYNPFPLTVRTNGIRAFPPINATYMHSFNLSGRTRLHDCDTGCFVATLEQGSHGVGGFAPRPRLARPRILLPIVFSVDENAEGLIYPSGCHPFPQDVYTFSPDTEGELFQSSGADLGAMPDMTNKNLNLRSALGLTSDDNIISLSFGQDGGSILLFSVDSDAIGVVGTPVEFNSSISPKGPPLDINLPSNGGGDPGNEAAGDIYISYTFSDHFGRPPVDNCRSDGVANGVVAAPVVGTNVMGIDEVSLGLQAPANHHSKDLPADKTPPEDDLDALEASSVSFVDSNYDGVIDNKRFVFFTLSAESPSLGTAKANDILVATKPATSNSFTFDIYARGIEDIGLLEGDVIDALALWDNISPKTWDEWDEEMDEEELRQLLEELGKNEALFSLAAGSPSLNAGANPKMPGPGPFSPGDVFRITFSPKQVPKRIFLYASAFELGLRSDDELNALDSEQPPPLGCLVTLIDNSFTATASSDATTLTWETVSEIDNAGFFVWRGQLKPGKTKCSKKAKGYTEVKRLNSTLVGTTGSGSLYSYQDGDVTSGNTYCYMLEDVDLNGKNTFHWDNIISASVP